MAKARVVAPGPGEETQRLQKEIRRLTEQVDLYRNMAETQQNALARLLEQYNTGRGEDEDFKAWLITLRDRRAEPRFTTGTPEFYRQEGEIKVIDTILAVLEGELVVGA